MIILMHFSDVPQYSGNEVVPNTVFKTKDYNNKTVMICTLPLSNGWQLGYSIDYREYSRSLRMLRTVYIAIFVPAILIVLFGGSFILKKCLKPVKSIHKAIISMFSSRLIMSATSPLSRARSRVLLLRCRTLSRA